MHETFAVRGIESIGDFHGVACHLLERQQALQQAAL